MWRDVARESTRFSSAVLTTVSADGPASVRCHPVADPDREVLVVDDPADADPGPASLLFHRHDDRLWKLRSCLVVGRLDHRDGEWTFVPERFVPGMGVGGPASYIRFLRRGRRTAATYLAHRGLPRPPVQWGEITDMLAAAVAGDRNVSGTTGQ